MDVLTKELARLSQKPEYGSQEYKDWIEQNDFISFLQMLNSLDEIILYTSMPHTFIYGILVPTRLVTPPKVDDLDRWGCNPFSSWGISIRYGKNPQVCLTQPLDDTGSQTLRRGEQILFAREFDGRQEQRSYVEISQRLAHAFDLHYVPEREAFCRFDERGDIEDVVRVSYLSAQPGHAGGRAVTIIRKTLEEYMAITNQALVLLCDSTRFDPKNFSGWQNHDDVHHQVDSEIYYRIGQDPGRASYLRGFQIIRATVSKRDVVKQYEIGE